MLEGLGLVRSMARTQVLLLHYGILDALSLVLLCDLDDL